MKKALVLVFACAVWAACDKSGGSGSASKSDGKKVPSYSCVLSDESGKTVKCIEKPNGVPKSTHERECQEYEAVKKQLVEGPCPEDGRTGVCDDGEGWRTACYDDAERCERSCSAPKKFIKD